MAHIKTTLQEDMAVLGLNVPVDEDGGAQGTTVGDAVTKAMLDEIEALDFDQMTQEDYDKVLSDLGEMELPDGDDELREQAERVVRLLKAGPASDDDDDPIEGKVVTKELFDRIEALDFGQVSSEDCDELLGELAEKTLPEGDDELREQAERVVLLIKEGAANRQRRFSKLSTKRKLSFQCPQGQRAIKKGAGRPQCRPAHVVAGGMGQLNKEGRKKLKRSKSGLGQMSKRRSERADKRRMGMREGLTSPLALELMQVAEGVATPQDLGVRDEIVERVSLIFGLLNEEFGDQSVFEIYEEAMNTMMDTYEAGRLDEDAMGEDEFIAELEPVLSLITKSIEKIDEGELGNG